MWGNDRAQIKDIERRRRNGYNCRSLQFPTGVTIVSGTLLNV